MKPKYIPVAMLAVLLLAILACGQGGITTPDAAATLNPQYTAAAQTLEAMLTQSAPLASATPGPDNPQFPTSTPFPTNTPVTVFPTFTPQPTNTPIVIPTVQVNTPTPVSRCDWAQFEKDVSYPDGTVVGAGQKFTKTWRIKNIGTCTWTTGYSLIFADGNAMGGPASVKLAGSVAPGQTVDLSVELVAPATEGEYRGNWKLRNANGVIFGVGKTANNPFWVDIKVSTEGNLVYDFAANYCDAAWRNGTDKLPCPGNEGSKDGYVLHVKNPVFENGYKDDEPALLAFPERIKDGVIQGKFPAIRVKQGYHFKAFVLCENNAPKCNVAFRLSYQIGSGQVTKLGEWKEIYDDKYSTVDVDLSNLAGKDVKFLLVVLANGQPTDDYALWFAPRIVQALNPTPLAVMP
ncbi:MAG: NBR1-Ig-like domain-containing protein [Chloroflexota bacterium]